MTGDRPSWLQWRRGGVGGSDAPGVVGLSPWSSPWSIWADKRALLPPEPETEVMAAGRWLEAAIGPWFTHETGLAVAGEQTWCTHPEHDHHRATVDGFVAEYPDVAEATSLSRSFAVGIDEPLGLLEIKVTGPGRRWEHLPEDKQAQGQWQMHVCGLDRVWFAVLMGRRLDIHELARDQADIDFLVERADRFWTEHVLTGDPPPIDGSDATTRALAAVYDGPQGDPRPAAFSTEDIEHEYHLWRAAREEKRLAVADEELHGNRLRAFLGDANATELLMETGPSTTEPLASWRPQTTRRLDVSALRAAHPDIARQFTTESTTRVLRPHARKEKP